MDNLQAAGGFGLARLAPFPLLQTLLPPGKPPARAEIQAFVYKILLNH